MMNEGQVWGAGETWGRANAATVVRGNVITNYTKRVVGYQPGRVLDQDHHKKVARFPLCTTPQRP